MSATASGTAQTEATSSDAVRDRKLRAPLDSDVGLNGRGYLPDRHTVPLRAQRVQVQKRPLRPQALALRWRQRLPGQLR